jgi:conjugal transfer pilus assembly protein TraF
MFAKDSGLPVLTITLDGGQIPHFPDAKPDNGISLLASGGEGVRVVPAIYLVSRDQKEIIPLSVGVVAAGDLADRIRVVVGTKPGEEF